MSPGGQFRMSLDKGLEVQLSRGIPDIARNRVRPVVEA